MRERKRERKQGSPARQGERGRALWRGERERDVGAAAVGCILPTVAGFPGGRTENREQVDEGQQWWRSLSEMGEVEDGWLGAVGVGCGKL